MKMHKFIALSLAAFLFTGCAAGTGGSTEARTTPTTVQATEATETWPTPDKLIALTFDDGPSTDSTVQILDLLAQYDAKATFFVIGKKVNSSTTDILQRTLDEGHELGNHSMSHLNMTELTDDEIVAEYEDCQKAVKDAVGVDMYFFRAPFNSTNDRVFSLVPAPFMGYAVYAGDGSAGSIAADRAWKITSKAYDGCIALLHCYSGNTETVEALKTILPELKAQGYEFVTLTELFTRNGGQVPGPTTGVKIPDNKPLNP